MFSKIVFYPKLVFPESFLAVQLSRCAFRRIRRLNLRDSPLGRSLVSTDLTSDEIPATGGRQRFALEDDTEFSALKEEQLRCSTDFVSAYHA